MVINPHQWEGPTQRPELCRRGVRLVTRHQGIIPKTEKFSLISLMQVYFWSHLINKSQLQTRVQYISFPSKSFHNINFFLNNIKSSLLNC